MSIETMTKIATYTVGAGGSSSITFSNIPQTYTDLKIVGSTRDNVNDTDGGVLFTFNNNTDSIYSYRTLFGRGGLGTYTSTNASSQSNITVIDNVSSGATANTFANWELYIPNYNSSLYKSISFDGVTEQNASRSVEKIAAGLWSNTAPITSISFTSNTSANFVQYSTVTLYGVKAVRSLGYSPIKATGGTIIQDGQNVYHVFNSSGTFSPIKAMSVDVLVVAGGGGGGADKGAGGGAGGICYQTTRALTTTAYTVTVGGGGTAGTGVAGTATRGGTGNNSVFDTITSNGGGGGGADNSSSTYNGVTGGSGGGGTRSGTGAAANQSTSGGATGYGNAGGNGYNSGPYTGGGGGGAGAVGGNGSGSSPYTGAGGIGLNTWSTWATATSSGDSGYYGGGGGGGGYDSSATTGPGPGGLGGGGAGGKSVASSQTVPPNAGLANTGGGGGGGGNASIGAAGGSGLVIVRYPAWT